MVMINNERDFARREGISEGVFFDSAMRQIGIYASKRELRRGLRYLKNQGLIQKRKAPDPYGRSKDVRCYRLADDVIVKDNYSFKEFKDDLKTWKPMRFRRRKMIIDPAINTYNAESIIRRLAVD